MGGGVFDLQFFTLPGELVREPVVGWGMAGEPVARPAVRFRISNEVLCPDVPAVRGLGSQEVVQVHSDETPAG
jgi:hypothetical protein